MLPVSRDQLRVDLFRDFVKLLVVLIRKRDVQRLRRNAEVGALPSTTIGDIVLSLSLFPGGGDFLFDVLFDQPVETLSQ